MNKLIGLGAVMLIGLLAACGSPTPTPTPQRALTVPTIAAPSGYRPPQAGDTIEGAAIAYQYVLPALDKPVVALAFGSNLLQLVTVRAELSDGLVAYIRELPADKPVLAFDEANPGQTELQSLKWDPSKPVEIIFIPLTEGKHTWSVAETYKDEVQAAYKIVRRKDGGLRFIDVYGVAALQSANMLLPGYQGGIGLMLSARLALLKTILSNEKYQRGENVMETTPPTMEQYDPRILRINPAAIGLAQNEDWVLSARPGPGGGKQAP
jgi:hypothetical protein